MRFINSNASSASVLVTELPHSGVRMVWADAFHLFFPVKLGAWSAAIAIVELTTA